MMVWIKNYCLEKRLSCFFLLYLVLWNHVAIASVERVPTSDLVVVLNYSKDILKPAYLSDGLIEQPSLGLIGYFDSKAKYHYDFSEKAFIQVRLKQNKPKPSKLWDGRFLNWLVSARVSVYQSILTGNRKGRKKSLDDAYWLFDRQSEYSSLFSPIPDNHRVKVYTNSFTYAGKRYFLDVNGKNDHIGLFSDLKGLMNIHVINDHGDIVQRYEFLQRELERWPIRSIKQRNKGLELSSYTNQKNALNQLIFSDKAFARSEKISKKSKLCQRMLVLSFDDFFERFSEDVRHVSVNDCRKDQHGRQLLTALTLTAETNVSELKQQITYFDYYQHWHNDQAFVLGDQVSFMNREGALVGVRAFSKLKPMDNARNIEQAYSSDLVAYFIDQNGYYRGDNGDFNLGSYQEDPIIHFCESDLEFNTRFSVSKSLSEIPTQIALSECREAVFDRSIADVPFLWRMSKLSFKHDNLIQEEKGGLVEVLPKKYRPPYSKETGLLDLATMMESRLALVGRPRAKSILSARDLAYSKYVQRYRNRENQLYWIDDSGRLHSFSPNIDSSLARLAINKNWSLFPSTNTEYRDVDNEQFESYFLPHQPYVFDAKIFNLKRMLGQKGGLESVVNFEDVHPGGWGTVLTVPVTRSSLNKQSNSLFYYFYDVTDPRLHPALIGQIALPESVNIDVPPQLVRVKGKGIDKKDVWMMVVATGEVQTSSYKGRNFSRHPGIAFYDLSSEKQFGVYLGEKVLSRSFGDVLGMTAADISKNTYTDTLFVSISERYKKSGAAGSIVMVQLDERRMHRVEAFKSKTLFSSKKIIPFAPFLNFSEGSRLELSFSLSSLSNLTNGKFVVQPKGRDKLAGLSFPVENLWKLPSFKDRHMNRIQPKSKKLGFTESVYGWYIELPENHFVSSKPWSAYGRRFYPLKAVSQGIRCNAQTNDKTYQIPISFSKSERLSQKIRELGESDIQESMHQYKNKARGNLRDEIKVLDGDSLKVQAIEMGQFTPDIIDLGWFEI